MSRNTFEAWATPVDAPVLSSIADHTFVVSGNTHFGCWGSSDTTSPNAVKVAQGSGDKALCKANKYRGISDSACLGIYAVNGVCHQSANLFLYAVDSTILPLNKERPRGVIASHALYSVYGTTAPGVLPGAPSFFAAWLTAVYGQAYARCIFSSNENVSNKISDEIIFSGYKEDSLEFKIIKNNYSDIEKNANATVDNIITNDMQIMINHILKLDKHPNLKTHKEILKEKNNILTNFGLIEEEISNKKIALKSEDIKKMVLSLNTLAIDYQDDLKSKVGLQAFKNINGDDKFYNPINIEIALEKLTNNK